MREEGPKSGEEERKDEAFERKRGSFLQGSGASSRSGSPPWLLHRSERGQRGTGAFGERGERE